VEIKDATREELVEKLLRAMVAEGHFDILGADLPGYEIPDWLNYPRVDIVAQDKRLNDKVTIGIALTAEELQEKKLGVLQGGKVEPAVALEWLAALKTNTLSYPPSQIGTLPNIIIGIERQNEEMLIKLLYELGIQLEVGTRIRVEIL